MNTFGERLKQLRISRGITQDELVMKFNEMYNYKLTKSAISQYENNKRLPEIKIIQSFSMFFKVSIDYLLCTHPTYLQESPAAYIATKENIETIEVSDLLKVTKDAIEFNDKITLEGKPLTESSKVIMNNCLDIALELIKKNQ